MLNSTLIRRKEALLKRRAMLVQQIAQADALLFRSRQKKLRRAESLLGRVVLPLYLHQPDAFSRVFGPVPAEVVRAIARASEESELISAADDQLCAVLKPEQPDQEVPSANQTE